jgi:hypothetical protein
MAGISTNGWKGIGREILDHYLRSEKGEGSGGDAGQFGIDVFNNGFEDEFPGDSEDKAAGTYQGYSLEANRASENRPWGNTYGDRPKVHELNQPPAAQELGWRVVEFYPNRDQKSEFYRLAGTPAELRQMMQLVQAFRFVTGARISFEKWFEEWEKGFPEFKQERSTGNFALVGERQWERIKNPETRPRYRELTNSQQRADCGYRVIEYWSDRSLEEESILCWGTDSQLIQSIHQYEFLGKNRQEYWLGYPYAEYVYHHSSSLMLQVHMRLTKKPPWEPNSLINTLKLSSATLPRPYAQIPNVKPGITWEQIRDAAGGENGYEWGRFYAVARMGEELSEKIGKGNQIKCYASTQKNAVERVEAFAQLSNSRILTMTEGEEDQNKGQRAVEINFRNNSIKIYPAWLTVINDKLVRSAMGYGGKGKSTASGKKLAKMGRIDLWRRPAKVEEILTDLMSKK